MRGQMPQTWLEMTIKMSRRVSLLILVSHLILLFAQTEALIVRARISTTRACCNT